MLWKRFLPWVIFKIENIQTTKINSKVVHYEQYIFVTRVPYKKILEFGGFGKDINRQLRMKVQTYVNKHLVTDKVTVTSTLAAFALSLQ